MALSGPLSSPVRPTAKLFANQSGFVVPPSIGMKLRALVFAGDPEAVSFLKANEEIGLRIDYGQHKGREHHRQDLL